MVLILEYGRTLLKNLILPPAGPLLLAIIGALLLRRRARLARLLLALGLGSLWLLSLPVVADALTRLSEHYPPLDLAQPTQAQAIVILGGGGQRAYAPEYGGPAAEVARWRTQNMPHATRRALLGTGFFGVMLERRPR